MTRVLNMLIEAAEEILAQYGVEALKLALVLRPEDRMPMQQAMVRLNAALRPWRRV